VELIANGFIQYTEHAIPLLPEGVRERRGIDRERLYPVDVHRLCSIGGFYIITDTGTADREVLLYVNVLKNTFGGTDIDTDFADTHNCSHNPYSWTSLRIASL
jgi:hypothetical protein